MGHYAKKKYFICNGHISNNLIYMTSCTHSIKPILISNGDLESTLNDLMSINIKPILISNSDLKSTLNDMMSINIKPFLISNSDLINSISNGDLKNTLNYTNRSKNEVINGEIILNTENAFINENKVFNNEGVIMK